MLTVSRSLISRALVLLVGSAIALIFSGEPFAGVAAQQTNSSSNILHLETRYGRTIIRLRPDLAPRHVAQIRTLVNSGFYDGIVFHRVIAGFMAQTGDPTGTGTGGSRLPDLEPEFSSTSFRRGTVAMARAQRLNSANSQFFITTADAPFLNRNYTVIGQVTSGMQFIDMLKKGEGPVGMVSNPDKIVRLSFAAPEVAPPKTVNPAPGPSASVKPLPPRTNAPTPPAVEAKFSFGSGFRISTGQFVTNQHVINKCVNLKINGKSGGRVTAADPVRDLALVSVDGDGGDIARIRSTRIQLNESVTAAGFPLQSVFSGIAITNGTISRLSGLRGDTGEVQISAPVQPGNSGGPLLDAAGNVIGVVSSKLDALKVVGATGDIPQNVNFAINASALRSFLDSKGARYSEAGDSPDLSGIQIASRASGFTVVMECQR
jgi:peptidylprolyl isomerase